MLADTPGAAGGARDLHPRYRRCRRWPASTWNCLPADDRPDRSDGSQSSPLALLAGPPHPVQVQVLRRWASAATATGRSRIAHMPGLGRNPYPTLSVEENLQFARPFGHDRQARRQRIDA